MKTTQYFRKELFVTSSLYHYISGFTLKPLYREKHDWTTLEKIHRTSASARWSSIHCLVLVLNLPQKLNLSSSSPGVRASHSYRRHSDQAQDQRGAILIETICSTNQKLSDTSTWTPYEQRWAADICSRVVSLSQSELGPGQTMYFTQGELSCKFRSTHIY